MLSPILWILLWIRLMHRSPLLLIHFVAYLLFLVVRAVDPNMLVLPYVVLLILGGLKAVHESMAPCKFVCRVLGKNLFVIPLRLSYRYVASVE